MVLHSNISIPCFTTVTVHDSVESVVKSFKITICGSEKVFSFSVRQEYFCYKTTKTYFLVGNEVLSNPYTNPKRTPYVVITTLKERAVPPPSDHGDSI